MAEGRKTDCSENRYFTRKRSREVKPAVVVELSDSSSESNDDEDVSSSMPADVVESKSTTAGTVSTESSMECPVCLQPCIHPARLPCGHIFCFLCLKGIAQQTRRCAMCRQEISPDYLDKPDLLQVLEAQAEKETFEDGYQWFYEGRNGGWWQFEERVSRDLEEVKQLGIDKMETLICGTLYVIDLKGLVQYNKDNPKRRRKIKRELVSNVAIKGIAGIR